VGNRQAKSRSKEGDAAVSTGDIQEQLLGSIPVLTGSYRLVQIHKGYSNDRKYIVYDDQGRSRYLLRTYRIEDDANKQGEFERLRMMEIHEVRCSRPIAIGTLPAEGLGYMVLTYIEGEDCAEGLPRLTDDEQYRVGLQAGKELRKMHMIQCPDPIASWHDRMNAKHNRYRVKYAACGIAINRNEKLLAFIDDNLHLMQGRPNLFQHDDYHPSNLIMEDAMFTGIIDFNRSDWGDPIHEFVKVGMFSAEVSAPYSIGQIHGYHDNIEPSASFWRLYSLYLAMTLISSVVWILQVKPDERESMLAKIHTVMDDHDGFEQIVPRWYRQPL
jgi:aminoglycoside phosphotransferase (APT) family kinase protein